MSLRGFSVWALAVAGIVMLVLMLGFAMLREVMGPYGSVGPHSNWSAKWAGDVDGDGTSDFLLATEFEPDGGEDFGSVRVFSGKHRKCLRTIQRANAMGRAGDVNGDERDDVMIERSGRKVIIDVARGDTLLSFETDPSAIFAPMRDVDGDGCGDLLIGGLPRAAIHFSCVSAVSGKKGKILWTVEARDGVDRESPRPFGWNGVVVGDVNGDGIVDVAIDTDSDRVRVFSGRDGTTLRELEFPFDRVGGRLAAIGDLDGDGSAELALQVNRGLPVHVMSLGTGAELFSFDARLGSTLSMLESPGDWDVDGVLDLVLAERGQLRIHSGVDGQQIGRIDEVWYGEGTGDLNGDGRLDLLVTRNVWGEAAEKLDVDDVWSAGSVAVISGTDRSVLLELDRRALEPITH